jgi:DNA-directed RNA polymerase subunit K/omega
MYSLGQQYFHNKRPPATLGHMDQHLGFNARTNPTFDPRSTHPSAYGYIRNSFSQGLNLLETLMTGKVAREGLTSTNFKTAEVGALGRSINRLFESVVVSTGGAITYNKLMLATNFNQGYNIKNMRVVEVAGEIKFMPFDIKSITAKLNSENGWYDNNIDGITVEDKESDTEMEDDEIDWDLTNELVNELTPRTHSRYETTAILGHRAEQLSFGATPRVEIGKDDTEALDIAEREYRDGELKDLVILRQYLDGSIIEI